MDRCDLKTLKMLERNAALDINKITGYGHYIFVMDVRRPPFDNPDVRNALKFAVDRDDIVKKVFSGIGKPANDNPIAPTIPISRSIPSRTTNTIPTWPRACSRRPASTSSRSTCRPPMPPSPAPSMPRPLFKAHAAAADIDINVIREPADGYWDNVWLKKPFVASYWNGRPTFD